MTETGQGTDATARADGAVRPDGGGELGRDEKYCENCGSAIKKEAAICPECGVSQESSGGGATGGGGGGGAAAGAAGGQPQTQGTTQPQNTEPKEPMGRWASGIIGGIAAMVLSFIPLVGTLIGYGLAGYLRGSDNKESAISGAIAGVVSSIPLGLFFLLFLGLGALGSIAEGDAGGFVGVLLVFGLPLLLVVVLGAGFGAVGGYVGAEVTDRGPPS